PMSENHLYIFSSSFAFLMLVLALSVYFHPKFGTNLTDKNIQIGMLLDFVGNGIVMLGGVLLLKYKEVDFGGDAVVKPLIDMEDRIPGDFRTKNPNENTVRDVIQESMDDLTKPPSNNINNY
ncbi:hypothetical protein HZC20_00005, partial [Candidatus Peregrinibacteria bacterium]|nr:hypothetical protein [Candidatus Peregrinibacteria bacterium]